MPESLKLPADEAEEALVFFPRTEQLDLTPERIHGLRISLNAPVVGLAGIPTGPARASILIHDETDGRSQVTIGIRSLRSGDVVVFSFEGEFGDDLPLEIGIDAALSFAESMGFLFDDDEVQAGGEGARERARGLWVELMGTPTPGAGTPAAELFDHADLSDLRADDSFQLAERPKVAPAGPLRPAQPLPADEPELELADTSYERGEEQELDAPAYTPPTLSLQHDAAGDDELELDLELAEPGAAAPSASSAHEPFIDLATEAVELGPGFDVGEMHEEAAAEPPSPPPPPPPPPQPEPGFESFDLEHALQDRAEGAPPAVFTVGLLTKFRFAPSDEAISDPSVSCPDAADAHGAASAAARAEHAANSRTALGRVRLVKRRAPAGEGSTRLPPVQRLLTSF